MLKMNRSKLAMSAVAASMFLLTDPTSAAVSIEVSFDDPMRLYDAYYQDLTTTIQAAGQSWVNALGYDSTYTTLTVSVGFAAIPTANGRSATASFTSTANGIDTYEEGGARKLKDGFDVNGNAADIEFNVGINGYLQQELWFLPANGDLTAAVPQNKTDAYSVFMHEFGHALGFNGWRDGNSGDLPGNYQSTFDAQVVHSDQANVLLFTGTHAMAVYGGPVPLTLGNYAHVGNPQGSPGADLLPDLMNGVVYYRGQRYNISALDLAIIQDTGLPVPAAVVPEPGTVALTLTGLALVAWRRRP